MEEEEEFGRDLKVPQNDINKMRLTVHNQMSKLQHYGILIKENKIKLKL